MTAIALLGSGEFEPWARTVDSWCVERATATSDRALVVPTASAPEGEDVFRRWAEMGTAHYRALGLSPEVLDLRARVDASRPAIVDAVAGARLIFFSGGNPGYLAETCAGTPFWDAVLAALAQGTALGGCSAGAVFLGTRAPFVADRRLDRWVPGLGLLSRAFLMPHFDALDGFQPGLRALVLRATPDGSRAVGLDEKTALFGDGESWEVAGAGSVWIAPDGAPEELVPHGAAARVKLPLGLRV